MFNTSSPFQGSSYMALLSTAQPFYRTCQCSFSWRTCSPWPYSLLWERCVLQMTWTLLVHRVHWITINYMCNIVLSHQWRHEWYPSPAIHLQSNSSPIPPSGAFIRYTLPGSFKCLQHVLHWWLAQKFLMASSPRLAGPNTMSFDLDKCKKDMP